MNCGATLVFGWGLRSKKFIPKQITCIPFVEGPEHLAWFTERIKTEYHIDTMTVCDGKIVANICAEDEPYFGGSSAQLNIEFRCEKCGNTMFRGVPETKAQLDALLTKYVEEL